MFHYTDVGLHIEQIMTQCIVIACTKGGTTPPGGGGGREHQDDDHRRVCRRCSAHIRRPSGESYPMLAGTVIVGAKPVGVACCSSPAF